MHIVQKTVIAGIILLILILGYFYPRSLSTHIFEGVSGPDHISSEVVYHPTSYNVYANGSASRMAVLLTNENSNWLGLAHGLKTIGIPFVITKDYQRALTHDVVFVYPSISGKLMSPQALNAIRQHPENGGTLIGTNVLGGGMSDVFGFDAITESKDHAYMTFNGAHDLTKGFKALEKSTIKIGNDETSQFNAGSNSYSGLTNKALAVYENDEAAITYRDFDSGGRSFAYGFDLGQLLLKGYNWRDAGIAQNYVNAYQPTLDALLKLVLNTYKTSSSAAITLGTVPEGKSLATIITHDVDFTKSIKNAIDYAKMEKEEGVRATYFIQTKYMKDFNDDIFINDEGASYVSQLKDLGMEIASHSVSHSLQFHEFPMGDGRESYPKYRPFVLSKNRTKGASLLGELRVSKFLLETFAKNSEVISFRPGFLRNPDLLPEALARSGYKYSSAATANKSLTHFPFQLNKGRAFESEINIFEFPITVEDEKLPLMGDRLPEALGIADKIKDYGGTFVLLNHPDILGHKFEFEQKFIRHVKPYAWFGTLGEYGDWWSARNEVTLDTTLEENGIVEVTLNSKEPIKGLTLELPNDFKIIKDDKTQSLLKLTNQQIILPEFQGEFKIQLKPFEN